LTKKIIENKFLRVLLILGGFTSIFIGVLGIFLPLIPTTPLILLAAYLFGKSSDKFHLWLIENKLFGKYIKNYQAGKGITVNTKITAIVTMWATLVLSILFATELLIIRILLTLVGIGVTIHLLKMRTYMEEKKYKPKLNEE